MAESVAAAKAEDTVPAAWWNKTGCAFKLKIEQERDKTPRLTQVFIEENAAYRHRLHRLNRNEETGFCLASCIEKKFYNNWVLRLAWAAATRAMGTRNGEHET